MPIFAFQIGIGFKKTSSKPKYIFRMFLCAILSELPFLLMLSSANYIPSLKIENISYFSLNICFTFLIGLIALYFIEIGKKNPIFYVVSLFLLLISYVIPMDYGLLAVLLVILSYFFSDKKILFCCCTALASLLYFVINQNTLQLFMLFALLFICLYNGKKGKSFKYFFYIFYPLHMLILAMLNMLFF